MERETFDRLFLMGFGKLPKYRNHLTLELDNEPTNQETRDELDSVVTMTAGLRRMGVKAA